MTRVLTDKEIAEAIAIIEDRGPGVHWKLIDEQAAALKGHIDAQAAEIARLHTERDTFAQGCWDMAAECCMDTDGDTGPGALIAGMGVEGAVGALLRHVQEFVTDANNAVDEVCMAPKDHAEIARLRAAEVPLSANHGFAFQDDEGHVGLAFDGEYHFPYPSVDDACCEMFGGETVLALIPLTAWDRT